MAEGPIGRHHAEKLLEHDKTTISAPRLAVVDGALRVNNITLNGNQVDALRNVGKAAEERLNGMSKQFLDKKEGLQIHTADGELVHFSIEDIKHAIEGGNVHANFSLTQHKDMAMLGTGLEVESLGGRQADNSEIATLMKIQNITLHTHLNLEELQKDIKRIRDINE